MNSASITVAVGLLVSVCTWSAFTPYVVAQGTASTVELCRFDNPQTLAARGMRGCVLEGTWAFQGLEGPVGQTITFSTDGTWASSEHSTGTYEVIGNSILIDVDDDDATNYLAWTYLGTLPDGQRIFAFQNTLGFTTVP